MSKKFIEIGGSKEVIAGMSNDLLLYVFDITSCEQNEVACDIIFEPRAGGWDSEYDYTEEDARNKMPVLKKNIKKIRKEILRRMKVQNDT